MCTNDISVNVPNLPPPPTYLGVWKYHGKLINDVAAQTQEDTENPRTNPGFLKRGTNNPRRPSYYLVIFPLYSMQMKTLDPDWYGHTRLLYPAYLLLETVTFNSLSLIGEYIDGFQNFDIDSDNGKLMVLQPLNRTVKAQHLLRIKVRQK